MNFNKILNLLDYLPVNTENKLALKKFQIRFNLRTLFDKNQHVNEHFNLKELIFDLRDLWSLYYEQSAEYRENFWKLIDFYAKNYGKYAYLLAFVFVSSASARALFREWVNNKEQILNDCQVFEEEKNENNLYQRYQYLKSENIPKYKIHSRLKNLWERIQILRYASCDNSGPEYYGEPKEI